MQFIYVSSSTELICSDRRAYYIGNTPKLRLCHNYQHQILRPRSTVLAVVQREDMDEEYQLVNYLDGEITIHSCFCDPTEPCRCSYCCGRCRCSCSNDQYHRLPITTKSEHTFSTVNQPLSQQPFMVVTQPRRDTCSCSTNSSFTIVSTDVEPESLPTKPLVVAPSLDLLSRSPANRTGDEITKQRTRDIMENVDGKSFLRHIVEPVSDDINMDQCDIFHVGDLSESMLVNHELSSSMLSSYSSSFAPTLSGSSLVIDAGAGLSDLGQPSRRNLSACRHGIPAHRCRHCQEDLT